MTFETMALIKELLENKYEEYDERVKYFADAEYTQKKKMEDLIHEKFPMTTEGRALMTSVEFQEFCIAKMKFKEEDPEMLKLQKQVEELYSIRCDEQENRNRYSRALTEFLSYHF